MERLNISADGILACVSRAVEVLKAGGLVIYPTDTVYGAGVDPSSNAAVERLMAYKGNGFSGPVPIVVSDREMAERYVELSEQAQNLYNNFLPGPLTVVSASKGLVDQRVASDRNTLGVRLLGIEFVDETLRRFGGAITTTSAAVDRRRWYSVEALLADLPKNRLKYIDLIVDAGELPIRAPSTVIDTTVSQYVVLRQGEFELDVQQEFVTNSVDETTAFGAELMRRVLDKCSRDKIVIALTGDLGAGKTHMTMGIAQALAITEMVKSPTFTLEHRYAHTGGEFRHLDVWRIQDETDMESLKLFQDESPIIYVIEWAERIQNYLKNYSDELDLVWVEIKYVESVDQRKIVVRSKQTLWY